MVATKKILGLGIYTPSEAAFYARVHTQTMKRWLFGDGKGERVIDTQLGNTDEKIVTFLDFVQALAIRAIRLQHNIPLPHIREAVDTAKGDFGVDYPFARKHQTFLMSDQKGEGHGYILIQLKREDGGKKFVQLSGKKKGNFVLKEIVEPFLDDLYFDHDTGLANEYRPMTHSEECFVRCNPHQRFGEPVIMPSGYTAQTLFDAIVVEGGITKTAKEYGVSENEVKLAYKYIDHLKSSSV